MGKLTHIGTEINTPLRIFNIEEKGTQNFHCKPEVMSKLRNLLYLDDENEYNITFAPDKTTFLANVSNNEFSINNTRLGKLYEKVRYCELLADYSSNTKLLDNEGIIWTVNVNSLKIDQTENDDGDVERSLVVQVIKKMENGNLIIANAVFLREVLEDCDVDDLPDQQTYISNFLAETDDDDVDDVEFVNNVNKFYPDDYTNPDFEDSDVLFIEILDVIENPY